MLHENPWMSEILQTWHGEDNQGDAAEFISHILSTAPFLGLDMTWERRIKTDSGIETLDRGGALCPLILHFTDELLDADPPPHISIQTMLDSWTNLHGTRTALTTASNLICLQLDRYFDDTNGQVHKYEKPIHFPETVQVPVFSDAGIDIQTCEYKVVAVLTHQGMDSAGHCRSLLKTTPQMDHPATKHLLTEDGQRPERLWNEPFWLRNHVSCVWICLASEADFAKPATWSTTPMSDAVEGHTAFAMLMQAFRNQEQPQ